MEPFTVRTTQGGTGPTDRILVQNALRGDRAAVDAVVERMGCVIRFVWRLNRKLGYGLPAESLEDVTQQVYLSAWPRLSNFAGTSALESWLFGFCRNCLRAELRRRGGRATTSLSDDFEMADPGDVADADDPLVRAEGMDALRSELDRLKPEERQVVELRHLQGISFEQIAQRTGQPTSTIKDRCYRALKKMEERLRRRHVGS